MMPPLYLVICPDDRSSAVRRTRPWRAHSNLAPYGCGRLPDRTVVRQRSAYHFVKFKIGPNLHFMIWFGSHGIGAGSVDPFISPGVLRAENPFRAYSYTT